MLYHEALAEDPDDAKAWAGLASAYSVQAGYGFGDYKEGVEKSKEAAERAMALDPDLPQAHEAMGWINLAFELRWDKAGEAFRHAHLLAPGNSADLQGGTPDIHYDGTKLTPINGAKLGALPGVQLSQVHYDFLSPDKINNTVGIARADLGPDAMIELDQELITSLECPNCHTVENVLKPLSEVSFEAGHCPTCGILRETTLTHVITGEEDFLHRTLASVGVPALHILRAQNGVEYRFYELTGDLPEALHFKHFELAGNTTPAQGRIHLKDEVKPHDVPTGASGRIKLRG